MKTLPQTLEACQEELTRIYKKKRMSKNTMLLFIIVMVAFFFGAVLGMQSGYHQCLVDFKIIAGTVI